MILVTGAAGKTGQAIIKKLLDVDRSVRVLVRREEQGQRLLDIGVRHAVVGDIADPSILTEASIGARAIYHICPNMHPDELSIGASIIQAARSAGVERFVYHSVLHPQIEAMPHHWQKMRVEELLLESGLSFTILQPAAYMQNVLANWDRIAGDGIYAVPYSVEARMSMVDLHDIAEVASKTLIEDGHEGAVYELCGSEILTQVEIAQIMGLFLRCEVQAVEISLDNWEHQARSAGLSGYARDTLLSMFRYYNEFGFWGNGRVLGCLLGHPPTTFQNFLKRAAISFT